MPIKVSEVRQLRIGAKNAHAVNIHRLGTLLASIADLGQMILDGSDHDIPLHLPDVVEKAARVARDLSRDTTSPTAEDLIDAVLLDADT